jgi:peptidoglycan-associated lipoprotein
MKGIKLFLVGLVILAFGLGIGCAKKTIRSDSPVYTPSRVEPGPAEARPEGAAPDKTADLEKEKKLAEESLREESLREKALREKALQEEAARREAAAREAAMKSVSLEPVFFDFDQWSVREDQKEVMAKNSQWLKSNPNVKVRLEGHCDERGTAEYNLALGQKRAEGVKSFLEGMGISSQRMATVSYGEERPLDPAHNEAAWTKNRRVDIVQAK